jgi:hypothetical protein
MDFPLFLGLSVLSHHGVATAAVAEVKAEAPGSVIINVSFIKRE